MFHHIDLLLVGFIVHQLVIMFLCVCVYIYMYVCMYLSSLISARELNHEEIK